jgi:hypothetical protein
VEKQFEKLRQPIRDKIIQWFKEHLHDDDFPCKYCIWDRLWFNDEIRPIHKCLKSGKNAQQILTYAMDEYPIIDFVKITNYASDLKNDIFWQYPEKDKEKLKRIVENADVDDYVCLHFNSRPNGEKSTLTEFENEIRNLKKD